MGDLKMGRKLWNYFERNSIYFLAIALFLFIFLPPFLKGENAFQYSILILSSFIIAFVILILPSSGTKRWNWILLFLLVIPWLMNLDYWLTTAFLLFFTLIYSITSYRIINIVLKEEEVDLRVVVGSVVGYLLIGLSFTFLCALLVQFYPHSFDAPEQMSTPYSFVYFTFVTLSTLGYGDVTPSTPPAQALSLLIAISGQFYMVIIVAVIVGKFISMRPKNQVNL